MDENSINSRAIANLTEEMERVEGEFEETVTDLYNEINNLNDRQDEMGKNITAIIDMMTQMNISLLQVQDLVLKDRQEKSDNG